LSHPLNPIYHEFQTHPRTSVQVHDFRIVKHYHTQSCRFNLQKPALVSQVIVLQTVIRWANQEYNSCTHR